MIIDFDLGLEVCIGWRVEQHVAGGVLHAAQRYDLWLQVVCALVECGQGSACCSKKGTSVSTPALRQATCSIDMPLLQVSAHLKFM